YRCGLPRLPLFPYPTPFRSTAAEAAGVRVDPHPVASLSDVDAGTVVVAAGTGTAGLTGLPVRPVKGQLLRLRAPDGVPGFRHVRSEEHTSELQSRENLVCRL